MDRKDNIVSLHFIGMSKSKPIQTKKHPSEFCTLITLKTLPPKIVQTYTKLKNVHRGRNEVLSNLDSAQTAFLLTSCDQTKKKKIELIQSARNQSITRHEMKTIGLQTEENHDKQDDNHIQSCLK